MKRQALHSLAVVLLFALAWVGCDTEQQSTAPSASTVDVATKPVAAGDLAAVKGVQNRHTDLLKTHGVVGTAIGLAVDGSLAIKVLTEAAGVAGIPTDLEGVPVEVEVVGKIVALGEPVGKAGKGGGSTLTTTSKWPRPVPIGISTGNQGECSAGTISCRVTNGTNVYALSNNHVYALENNAPLGSSVLQPGIYDTGGCIFDPSNVIGTLANFEPIKFDGSNNTIDAAIASSSTVNLGNATPSNGYGTPKSAVVSAVVGQQVQKYGRTTSLTKGQVTMINATIQVGYSSGTAQFVDQIIVQALKPFIKAGDSGSLLVTNPDRNPVGLLFAGNQNGTFAVANRVDLVLSRFGVTIDGQ